MIIEPTPGRIVWFWPNGERAPDGSPCTPQAAMIVGVVESPSLINLITFSHWGEFSSQLDVHLVQEGDEVGPSKRYATWMPYQVSQAKKHADAS